MNELTCEMCGSTNVVKEDGLFVCQSCGTKYSVEEAKKIMQGTVTIDKSSEKENMKILAKRYYNNQEWEKADDYYDRIIELDPHDWEAVYYGGLASAQRSTFDNLRLDEAIIGAENAIKLVEPNKKDHYFKIFRTDLLQIATQISDFIGNIGNANVSNVVSDFGEGDMVMYLNALVNIATGFDRILTSFPVTDVKKGDDTWNAYLHILECSRRLQIPYSYHWGHDGYGNKVHKPFPNHEYAAIGKGIEETYVPKIRDVDPEFELPEVPTGGCYVATSIYGSYDCPEVWTLRRFRDNTLAKTIPGRLFIKFYYAVSPTVVKYFGDTKVFKNFFKPRLDKLVSKLQEEGVESSYYIDE